MCKYIYIYIYMYIHACAKVTGLPQVLQEWRSEAVASEGLARVFTAYTAFPDGMRDRSHTG